MDDNYIPIDEEATAERIAEVRAETENELDLLWAMIEEGE